MVTKNVTTFILLLAAFACYYYFRSFSSATKPSCADHGRARRHPSVNVVSVTSLTPSSADGDWRCNSLSHRNGSFTLCLLPKGKDLDFRIPNAAALPEVNQINTFIRLFETDRRLQFVDIGANIGTYTLPIAHVGVRVLAVEPHPMTHRVLADSIRRSGFVERVTLVKNAVLNRRAEIVLGQARGNTGDTYVVNDTSCAGVASGDVCVDVVIKTILLDDLLPVMSSDRALIKIDTQGSEVLVFDERTSRQFLTCVDVPLIQMEWGLYSAEQTKYVTSNDRAKAAVKNCIRYMSSMKYNFYDVHFNKLGEDWRTWPGDILMMKNDTQLHRNFRGPP